MQIPTELKPMFSYSILEIIVTIIIIIVLLFIKKHNSKKEIKPNIIIPAYKDLISIKKNYLLKLKELTNNLNSNNISSRKAYQHLSSLIRNFIYETTNIKVQNYTLKEIEMIGIPILYELVNEYYDPEFAKISKGNISSSINKTRMVIEKWK